MYEPLLMKVLYSLKHLHNQVIGDETLTTIGRCPYTWSTILLHIPYYTFLGERRTLRLGLLLVLLIILLIILLWRLVGIQGSNEAWEVGSLDLLSDLEVGSIGTVLLVEELRNCEIS